MFSVQLHAPAVLLWCYKYWIHSVLDLKSEMDFFCKGKLCYRNGNRTPTSQLWSPWLGHCTSKWGSEKEFGVAVLLSEAVRSLCGRQLTCDADNLWRRQIAVFVIWRRVLSSFLFLCSNVIHWQKLWESFLASQVFSCSSWKASGKAFWFFFHTCSVDCWHIGRDKLKRNIDSDYF